ncbi:MAG: hypothetical protein WCL44_14165 [bacterium]
MVFQGIVVGIVIVMPFIFGSWILFARSQWWTIVPVACSFGGMVYFGFKIFTHELALAMAILALLPYIAMTQVKKSERSPLPVTAYLLFGYLSVHLLVSEYICIKDGMGGMGNILRVYMHGLWPLIFAMILLRYGSTRHLRYVLLAMYIALFGRVALGIISLLAPHNMLFIPFINYVLPGTFSEGMDLRASTLLLSSMALCYSSLSKSGIAKAAHLLVLIPAGYLLLLGAGRISLTVYFGIILFWALLQRKFVLLGVVTVSLALLIGVLNSDPSVIQNADPRVQRTLSILIIESGGTDVHKLVDGRDRWHSDWMRHGRERWLTSPATFIFGNRVHRYDETFTRTWASHAMRVEMAARMGAYEAGLWTVLAVTGIVGAILYLLLFRGLLTDVAAALLSTGIRDHGDAFSFLAVSGALTWLLLCWVSGNFPSLELMFAVIAKAVFDDRKAIERQAGEIMVEPTAEVEVQ